jgi:hypothetical protein
MTTTLPPVTSEALAVDQFLRTSARYFGLDVPVGVQRLAPLRHPSLAAAARPSARGWVPPHS